MKKIECRWYESFAAVIQLYIQRGFLHSEVWFSLNFDILRDTFPNYGSVWVNWRIPVFLQTLSNFRMTLLWFFCIESGSFQIISILIFAGVEVKMIQHSNFKNAVTEIFSSLPFLNHGIFYGRSFLKNQNDTKNSW